MTDSPPLVHILLGGHALCGFPGVPGDWPPGHKWTRVEDADHEATCPRCVTVRGYAEALARTSSDPPKVTSSGPPIVTSDDPGIVPEVAAIRGMYANEGAALLRALFAWRAQGSVTRWRTRPSRALAALADRLAHEYPDTTRALREQGERDAAQDAIGRLHSLATAKGRARELGRVGRELAALAEDVNAIGYHEADAAEDERDAAFERRMAREDVDEELAE